VTKAPKLTKEMGLIDWTKPTEQVCRQIRAMQPWPTAYTYLHRKGKPPVRVIINSAVEFPVRYSPEVPPGTAFSDPLGILPKSMFVTVAEVLPGEERGVVEILELQPAGKKRMTAEEFLRGHPLTEGDRFGPETA